MFTRLAVLALTCVLAHANIINHSNGHISMKTEAGRNLVQNARKTAENGYSGYYGNVNGQSQYSGDYQEIDWNNIDISYLAGYSVKFQGCHHVQQWNDNADGEDDIKIMTQRLVRFRMCPADSCSSTSTKGCDSNYGDYIVDMETYVNAYMQQIQEQYMNNNQYYKNNGNRQLANQQENKYNLNFEDYLSCSQMEMDNDQRRHARKLRELNGNYGNYAQYYQNGDLEYYIGPYCADQGGEIRLGVFYDDTCTVAAEEGGDIFQMVHNGITLPYSMSSMVNLQCQSCGGYGEVNDFCSDLYEVAGKCETRMKVYYPNESACSYLEGIKIIREDGVIRTSATRKSTAAAVTTGIFLTGALMLSGYVYYLRTKLGRARINLASSGI
mmetsp:Transcript_11391/g.32811  ORF Transcript_11391/g.32811 Transcript_11391/m.32811 type:complete len:383 (+) Transcript_11391:107-1255(+)